MKGTMYVMPPVSSSIMATREIVTRQTSARKCQGAGRWGRALSKNWNFTPARVVILWNVMGCHYDQHSDKNWFWANRNWIYTQFMSGENDNNEKSHGWFWYRQAHVSTEACSFVTLWDVATFAHDCDRIGKWPRGLLNKREYLLLWIQVQ